MFSTMHACMPAEAAAAQVTESCGTLDEYTMHICRCKDPGCNGLFHITVRELYTWMVETLGSHVVASRVEAYLLARGETAMLSLRYGARMGGPRTLKKLHF
jgi:hypothetical protein